MRVLLESGALSTTDLGSSPHCDASVLPDAQMPVDYLTKNVSQTKIDMSIAYLTGALRRAAYLDGHATVTSAFVAALSHMSLLF